MNPWLAGEETGVNPGVLLGYDLHAVCLPRQIAWVEGLQQPSQVAA